MKPPRLVCLGNLTLDDIVLPDGTVQPLCTGGDALYAALAARHWEPATEMVAPVGNDLPPAVIDRMDAAGLSRAGLPLRDLPTLHNRIDYAADGGREWTLYATDAAFHTLSPTRDDIPPDWRGADAFLILAMTLEAQEGLAASLKATGGTRAGTLIALDPQEDYVLGNEARLRALVSKVDIFLPSAEEVVRLAGHSDWSRAARDFAALGPSVVVVKLGAEGCLVHDREHDREFRVPAYPTTAVDTTGAGDSFCGAFIAALLQDRRDLAGAAWAAAVAASFAVEGYGVDPLWSLDAAAIAQRLSERPPGI